jgi:hypothetical protein
MTIKTKILVLIRLRCAAKVFEPNKCAASTKRMGTTGLENHTPFQILEILHIQGVTKNSSFEKFVMLIYAKGQICDKLEKYADSLL